jgi:F0F1-type ATP synthase membrane subunit b/b'
MSSAFVVSAVSAGVVVIVVAAAVVLVVLFVTLSMRGRQKRGARRIDDARRDVDEARGRAAQAERDRDIAREGGDDLGPRR